MILKTLISIVFEVVFIFLVMSLGYTIWSKTIDYIYDDVIGKYFGEKTKLVIEIIIFVTLLACFIFNCFR